MKGSRERERASAYAASGVDIDAGDAAVDAIMKHVRSTYGPKVLKLEDGFAGLVKLDGNEGLFKKNLRQPVLASCTDGVGTKLKIAIAMNIHDTVGIDLVAMSVNDLITLGIEPLIFLDYIGIHKVQPEIVERIVAGVARGCRQCGANLIGGEIAELTDIYAPGDYDLVGFCAGVGDRKKLITGAGIRPGDTLIGLPSSGLHSNGYTLARKALDAGSKAKLAQRVDELGCELGLELLKPTRIYVRTIQAVLKNYRVKKVVHGIAHITGGGLPANIKRLLPNGCKAVLEKSTWRRPPIFDLISRQGKVEEEEMYDVFNMGLGMVLIVSPHSANAIFTQLSRLGENPSVVGRIVRGRKSVEIH